MHIDGRLKGMDVKCVVFGIEIPNSDWERTPASVKELVEKLGQEKDLADHEAQNQELLEKINRTSNNSSSPPSADRYIKA